MALLFTGTDDPPYNPLKTDEVCALSLSLTDWNITQNPDPVTYTSFHYGKRDNRQPQLNQPKFEWRYKGVRSQH